MSPQIFLLPFGTICCIDNHYRGDRWYRWSITIYYYCLTDTHCIIIGYYKTKLHCNYIEAFCGGHWKFSKCHASYDIFIFLWQTRLSQRHVSQWRLDFLALTFKNVLYVLQYVFWNFWNLIKYFKLKVSGSTVLFFSIQPSLICYVPIMSCPISS